MVCSNDLTLSYFKPRDLWSSLQIWLVVKLAGEGPFRVDHLRKIWLVVNHLGEGPLSADHFRGNCLCLSWILYAGVRIEKLCIYNWEQCGQIFKVVADFVIRSLRNDRLLYLGKPLETLPKCPPRRCPRLCL